MYAGRAVLALITARGGSKRLPRKNVLPLGGKPLVAWTVEAAKAAGGLIDRVAISTDDAEIADAARKAGAEVPFTRPPELASDTATSMDVVFHALDFYQRSGEAFGYVVLLQPTSPLRTGADLVAAFDVLSRTKASAVVSVCQAEHHPLWANTLPPDGSLKDFIRPELRTTRSQDLPPYYRLNGAVYVAETGWLARNRSFIGDGAHALVMPAERSVDIDSEVDLALAQALLAGAQRR